MAHYRLYHIRGAHFSGSDVIHAADDAQAIDEAERLGGTGHSELWRDGHKLMRLSPGATDRGPMNREAIAWLLIGLIVLVMAATIAWKVYHSRDRRIGRQRDKARARRERRIDEAEED